MWDIVAGLCIVAALFFLVRRYIGNARGSCGCHGCTKCGGEEKDKDTSSCEGK